ncbi:SRPBCC domain-containing protein [Streptomyces sp. NPDC059009]|uniref:SRPBCC domain-containing protein n=1 Tax=Streptomyces sp. NPDC059009 TaxID=3346694 RepID=UPI003689596B
MDHEVFVPVPAEALRKVLDDPERVAGAVPGLQRDADAYSPPLSGRLKVRVGGHAITYKGSVRIARRDGDADADAYELEAEGTEVRGSGAVKVALTVKLVPADGGTTLAFAVTASGGGRVAESSPQAVEGAGRRLLERFGEGLGVVASRGEEPVVDAVEAEPDPDAAPDSGDLGDVISIFDTEVPPPSLDPLVDEGADVGVDEDMDEDADESVVVPPAEAAHARRTMIGRSAEEVDHAPPRGRYAPAPAPETTSATATLRWAAPAAAVVVASAIVVGRVLRRRR